MSAAFDRPIAMGSDSVKRTSNSHFSGSSLDSIFAPHSIAVVGASDQPGSVGGAIFSNLRTAGFSGPLFAVNRKRGVIHGEQAFGSLAEIPETPDLVSFAHRLYLFPNSFATAVVVVLAG